MFLTLDQRSIPPRWEPPRPSRREGDPAIILILVVIAMWVLARVGGGTMFAMVWALCKLW